MMSKIGAWGLWMAAYRVTPFVTHFKDTWRRVVKTFSPSWSPVESLTKPHSQSLLELSAQSPLLQTLQPPSQPPPQPLLTDMMTRKSIQYEIELKEAELAHTKVCREVLILEKESEIQLLREKQRIEECYRGNSILKEFCDSRQMLSFTSLKNITQTDPIVSHPGPLTELGQYECSTTVTVGSELLIETS